MGLAGEEAAGHRLPGFPEVRLLEIEAARDDLLRYRLKVQVRDPAGREPLLRAGVTVRAIHATLGSASRVEPVLLAPVEEPGIYGGQVRFPRAGRWELTVEVVGRFVGDAHFPLDILAPDGSDDSTGAGKPDLPFDVLTIRHLATEWGHLAGFALWLAATAVGILDPTGHRRLVLAGTWAAFAIEGVTGLYKMEYSTPFATPLRLFRLGQPPRVFFAGHYAATLVVKHVLLVMAMIVTLALTFHAWRSKPGSGTWLWRALLGVNALLALAIGGRSRSWASITPSSCTSREGAMNARRAFLGGLVVTLIAGGGLAAWPSLGDWLGRLFGRAGPWSRTEGALEKLDVYGRVPDFSLTERSGRQVTLADLRAKVWVANFIYTGCTETCPIQTAQLARVQTEFAGEEDLRLVSITVDPERDTPQVLARYAERYGAHPSRWLFLTGDKRAIYRLAKEGFNLGVVDPDDQVETSRPLPGFGPTPALAAHGSKGLVIHSARLVLVDRQARIRAYHLPNDEHSLERLRENVRRLLRERAEEM